MTRVLAVAGLAASVALPFSTRVRAAQVVVPAQERFVEPLSQLSFPLEVQGWSRRRVLRYPDPAGHSVTYELKIGSELKSTATVYVYPHGPLWPPTVREHFLATVDELRSTSRASELITQQTIPAGAGRTYETWFGTILFRAGLGDNRRPVIGFLTVARVHDYWLKWRVDMAPDAPPEVLEKVQALLDSFIAQ